MPGSCGFLSINLALSTGPTVGSLSCASIRSTCLKAELLKQSFLGLHFTLTLVTGKSRKCISVQMFHFLLMPNDKVKLLEML